jgi:hypothetical protein
LVYLTAVLAILATALMVRQAVESRVSPEEGPLVVNSDPTDPAVPLDLSLTVRLLAGEARLEIAARVGKHPSFPAELFFDKGVEARIHLPAGLELQEGSLTWRGDLRGEQAGQFQAKVRAVRDLEAAVDASARGRAADGGRIDADQERFYVLVKGRTVRLSLNPFTASDRPKPGSAEEPK